MTHAVEPLHRAWWVAAGDGSR